MNGPAHRDNFDFVRLFAALCVLISHQFALSGYAQPVILQTHSLGGFGVLIFFTVSGFLVAQSWDADPHLGRFAARRLLRLWPALAGFVLLAVFVWAPAVSPLPLQAYVHNHGVHAYFNILRLSIREGLPVDFSGPLPQAFNGSLWTIPLELRCYLFLALCGAAGILRKWPLLIAVAVVLVRYAVIEARGDVLLSDLGWDLKDRYLLEFGLFFAAGVLLHYIDVRGRRGLVWWLVAAGWAAAGASVLAGRMFLALWFAVPVTVIAIGTASTAYLRRAGRFGDISYGLYIYAFPVQQTLIWSLGKHLSWLPLLALTLASTGALAFASWHLIEKKALLLKPRRKLTAAARPGPAGRALHTTST